MKLGSRIRVGLAAVTLLAQLVLPVVHGVFAAAEPDRGSSGPVVAADDGSNLAAHDPSVCPTCFAVGQVRAGIGRALPEASLPLGRVLCAEPVDSSIALPRAPDLGTAPPRAPPALALSFA
jgi:hypothetical protein